jgi:mRNA interferase MazF
LPINIKRGEIYDVDWNPGRGSEQAGTRPSLVVQTNVANGVAAYPVTIVLGVSSKLKGYPSMVRIEPSPVNGLNTPSEVNTGQVLTIDKRRLGKRWGSLSLDDMRKVEATLSKMLGFGLLLAELSTLPAPE